MNELSGLAPWDRNSDRNYPFVDGATKAFSGGFVPPYVFLDARIYFKGTYAAGSTFWISEIRRSSTDVTLYVSGSKGVLGSGSVVFGAGQDLVTLVADDGSAAGCLVIAPDKFDTSFEMVPEGVYTLDSTVLPFLASLVSRLPSPTLTSLNGLSGSLVLKAGPGIDLARVDASTVKVSVVGDPHFKRYGCDLPEALAHLEAEGRHVRRIRVKFWTPNSAGNLVPVEIDALPTPENGYSLPLAVSGAPVDADDRTTRPALRMAVSGDEVTFSLAGAS